MFDLCLSGKNALLMGLAASVDAGAPVPGRFLVYDGVKADPIGAPITTQVLLAECSCSLPCASVANATLTFGIIADEELAPATGEATWGRLVNGVEVVIADFDVGDEASEAFLKLNSTQIYQGGIVRITAGTLTV